VSRLPPLGLASSTRCRTGEVAICLLDIDRRLSRGGNILSPRRLENFLRTLDFLGRVAMHREQNFALLQATFVSLGFEFTESRIFEVTTFGALQPSSGRAGSESGAARCGDYCGRGGSAMRRSGSWLYGGPGRSQAAFLAQSVWIARSRTSTSKREAFWRI
jgi:hypothetical protein